MTDITRPRIIVLFAGAGGSTLGAHAALPDAEVVGIDIDPDACATHKAAGFETIQADVAMLSPRLYGPADGLWASPPCPAFSTAGQGAGTKELDALLAYLRDWTIGKSWRGDPAVWLVTEPLRWALTLMPEWVVLEQVPPVLPLWEATAQRLREVGYSAWTGILNAADYGVPQTRERAILLASRARTTHPPMATHAEHPHPRLDGTEELPWVTMAAALGWERSGVVEAHGTACHTPYFDPTSRPSRTICGNRMPRFLYSGMGDRGTHESRRDVDRPAPTVALGHDAASWQWRFDGDEPTAVTLNELATLQDFPDRYPFQGNKTSRARQIGNAVPPRLAQLCVAAVAA